MWDLESGTGKDFHINDVFTIIILMSKIIYNGFVHMYTPVLITNMG